MLSGITNNNVDEEEVGSHRRISNQEILKAKETVKSMLKTKNVEFSEKPEDFDLKACHIDKIKIKFGKDKEDKLKRQESLENDESPL